MLMIVFLTIRACEWCGWVRLFTRAYDILLIYKQKGGEGMVITRLDWAIHPDIPYVILTIDTDILYKQIQDIGIVRSRVRQWLKKRYHFLPVALGGYKIDRGDVVEYINNRYSGQECYTSRQSIQIKTWIETNHVNKFVFGINGLWLDPSSGKWLIRVEVYDPAYTM